MVELLAPLLAHGAARIGQIAVKPIETRFAISHVDDVDLAGLEIFHEAADAIALAKFDDAEKYRALSIIFIPRDCRSCGNGKKTA